MKPHAGRLAVKELDPRVLEGADHGGDGGAVAGEARLHPRDGIAVHAGLLREIAALREAIFEHTHRMEEPLREAACFVRLIGMLGLQDDEAHEPVATVAMAAWRKLKDVSEAWEALDDLAHPPQAV